MDAFYFPSVSEGQPNSLIEAIVSGLPFVSSNIPTIKEVVPENYYKYLVSPNDIVGAGNILSSFVNKNSKTMFNEAKEATMSNFSSNDRFQEFYNEL